jgi:hypothetical protein
MLALPSPLHDSASSHAVLPKQAAISQFVTHPSNTVPLALARNAGQAYIARLIHQEGSDMPIRTASLSNQIRKNGARLHLAMVSRVHSQGAETAASDDEKALLEERRLLKEAASQRQAEAKLPKPKAAKFLRTTPVAKSPKVKKEPKESKEPKAAKSGKAAKGGEKPSRADKVAKKAENLEAAKKAQKKSAKT